MIRAMETADRVLWKVEQITGNQSEEWTLYPYLNGREAGYSLTAYPGLWVAFSENRNSDEIVVYVGRAGDFEMAGHVPINSAWRSRRYFHPDHVEQAARYIVDYLMQVATPPGADI
jgi:hypothetical protein